MLFFEIIRRSLNYYPFSRGRQFVYKKFIKNRSFRNALLKVNNPFKTKAGYFIFLNHGDYTSNWIKLFGQHNEPSTYDFLNGHLKVGDRFVDIGANVGVYSLFVAHKFSGGVNVLSFEPNPKIHKHLEDSIKINHFEGFMKAFQMGVSDEMGVVKFSENLSDSGSSRFEENGGSNCIQLPVVNFDDWYLNNEKKEKSPIGCIKIDVEGFEVKVLRGIKNTLSKFKPALVIECLESNLVTAGYNSESLKNLLFEYGYTIQTEVEHNLYCIHRDRQ